MIFNDRGNFDPSTKTAVIMRDGVYTYLAGEFPGELTKDAAPDTKLRVYRSPESVKAAFKRFQELGKIPVVFEHPDEDLDLKDYSQGYGYDPELVEEGMNLAIKCKLHLEDESLEAYDEGIREISCGWSGDFKEADDKSIYDYEQTFEEFNHIALVPEGRCGTLCSIKDQKNGAKMKVKAKKIKDAKTASDSISKAKKYMDEMSKMVKSSEEIEDSHAEGLLTAIKGLKEAISGFEAFASQENMEPEIEDQKAAEADLRNAIANKDPEAIREARQDVNNAKTIEDEENPNELEEADVDVKEIHDEDEEIDEEEEVIEDEDVDKRKLLREADAIAMKPASDFEGGEEEKFRTLTKKLEALGYNRSSRGTANDAKARVLDSKTKRYLDARIKDAANLGMKLAVKRFHDVLPFIADGTIPFEDIKPGMTPCEIKQKFVEERTGRRFTDAKRLNVAFDLATRAQFNDGWNRRESFHADVLDEKAEAIAAIGTHRKGAK